MFNRFRNINRGSRPRQISHGGAAPPPPPPPLSISAGSVSAGLKKKLRGIGGGSKRDADADSTASVTTVRRPSSVFNFPINGNGKCCVSSIRIRESEKSLLMK